MFTSEYAALIQDVSRTLLHLFVHLVGFLVCSYLTAGTAEKLCEHFRQLGQTLFRVQDAHRLLHLLQRNEKNFSGVFVLVTNSFFFPENLTLAPATANLSPCRSCNAHFFHEVHIQPRTSFTFSGPAVSRLDQCGPKRNSMIRFSLSFVTTAITSDHFSVILLKNK